MCYVEDREAEVAREAEGFLIRYPATRTTRTYTGGTHPHQTKQAPDAFIEMTLE
jgi:hypothetical protein